MGDFYRWFYSVMVSGCWSWRKNHGGNHSCGYGFIASHAPIYLYKKLCWSI